MSTAALRVFPRTREQTRSVEFQVAPGEYGKLTGYNVCPGVCVRINQVHENRCNCEYKEKPYCIAGKQIGLTACGDAILPMPGVYVAYLCVDEGVELDDDFCVYFESCTNVENLQVAVMAALGANNE